MIKKSLAIVTMVYNEGRQLPRWIRHYSRHVEQVSDLYVINHGSSDGSIESLPNGINVINLERDDGKGLQTWRAKYVSDFVNKLKEKYEAVIYVDCDEYLVVDPDVSSNLFNYINNGGLSTHSIGFDVLHDRVAEPSLNGNLISEVRSKIQFVAAMCKPVVVLNNDQVNWQSGFHISNIKPVHGDLYLFHARYADINDGVNRLKITRGLHRPETANCPVDHQKIDDKTYLGWVDSWLKYPVSPEDITSKNDSIGHCIANFNYSRSVSGIYAFDYSFRSRTLYRIPAKFIGLF